MANHPFSENKALVEVLLDRLLFETLLRHRDSKDANKETDDTIDIKSHPMVLCMQFASVSRFYNEVCVNPDKRRNGRAILDLGLNTVAGLT
ncbi:hypothetical protein BGX33_002895, partial [Mortierella sp. NVP41]